MFPAWTDSHGQGPGIPQRVEWVAGKNCRQGEINYPLVNVYIAIENGHL